MAFALSTFFIKYHPDVHTVCVKTQALLWVHRKNLVRNGSQNITLIHDLQIVYSNCDINWHEKKFRNYSNFLQNIFRPRICRSFTAHKINLGVLTILAKFVMRLTASLCSRLWWVIFIKYRSDVHAVCVKTQALLGVHRKNLVRNGSQNITLIRDLEIVYSNCDINWHEKKFRNYSNFFTKHV